MMVRVIIAMLIIVIIMMITAIAIAMITMMILTKPSSGREGDPADSPSRESKRSSENCEAKLALEDPGSEAPSRPTERENRASH